MKHLIALIALVSMSLGGCAHGKAAELRNRANEYRVTLNDIGATIRGAHLAGVVACATYEQRVPALQTVCPKLYPLVLALDSAWRVAWSAVDAYDAGLGTIEAVEEALAAVNRAASHLSALVTEVENAIPEDPGLDQGTTGQTLVPRSGEGDRGAAEPRQQQPGAPAEGEAAAAADRARAQAPAAADAR